MAYGLSDELRDAQERLVGQCNIKEHDYQIAPWGIVCRKCGKQEIRCDDVQVRAGDEPERRIDLADFMAEADQYAHQKALLIVNALLKEGRAKTIICATFDHDEKITQVMLTGR